MTHLDAFDTACCLVVLAWGIFTDKIVKHAGGDPNRHIAVGVGYGLERFVEDP